MSDNNLRFSSEKLEPLILANCVINPSFFMKFKGFLATDAKIEKSYFNNHNFQRVFNLYSKYYDKFSKLPTEDTLYVMIDKFSDNEVKEICNGIVYDMFNTNPEEINDEFLVSETIDFIKENRVYEAIMSAQDDIDNKNYNLIVDKMQEAVRVNFDKNLGMSVKDVKENVSKIITSSNEKCVSTGYPNFDAMLDGGFKAKNLYVFSALPGGGKSMFMGNLALNAFYDNHKVLYYSFEMSDEKVIMRNYQNMANMSKVEALLNNDEFEEKLTKMTNVIDGDLIVKEYNSNSANSNDLMAHIHDLEIYKKWKPSIIFVDYILIMASTEANTTPSANSNLYYKRVAEDIRNIGKTLDIPTVSAIQINRDGMSEKGGSKAIITAKDMAASRGVLDTADYFGILAQTAKDRNVDKKFTLITDKSREGDISQKLTFNINYELMRIEEGGIITK